MLQRILVPLDGSQSAKAVLPFLRRLPLKAETRIILARVVEPGPKDPGPGFTEESLEFAESYLREVAGSLRSQGLLIGTAVRSDRVAEALTSIAEDERVSLIAMATHGRTSSTDRPFGGVTEQLIRISPVPILAVPSMSRSTLAEGISETIQPLGTILVTTDGSDYADAIAPLAAEIAAESRTAVILLQISLAAGSRARAVAEQAAAEKHLNGLKDIFEAKGIPTECMTGRGNPVNGILDLTRRRRIDLIAMSSHGGARRLGSAVGSVTQAVLQQSGIPVLMIRPRRAVKRPGDRRMVARSRRR